MSLDTTIFQILKAIDTSYENQNFNSETLDLKKLNISEQRLILHLENLVDRDFIKGIAIRYGTGYTPTISFSVPRLTLAGLDFLENNTAMKNAYKTLKEIKGWIPGL